MAQIAIGNDIYLHSGDKPQGAETHLLISAHGGTTKKDFTVPGWTNLHYYTKHGDSVFDPGIYAIMKGEFQVYETKFGGQSSPDYYLSKYQGRHGSEDETYESIGNNINTNSSRVDVSGRNFAFHFDVLTIRNRWNNFSGVKLSEALALLAANGHMYNEIHCSFCRDAPGGKTVNPTKFGQ